MTRTNHFVPFLILFFLLDVAFGGVFRCTQELQDKFGEERVFNTPISENGIAGFAAGYASAGGTAIGEIQFADYIFPAFDQIVNEIAKFRYRSGNQWNCGGLTLRAPCGAVSLDSNVCPWREFTHHHVVILIVGRPRRALSQPKPRRLPGTYPRNRSCHATRPQERKGNGLCVFLFCLPSLTTYQGLLLSSIRGKDPVVFLEPKVRVEADDGKVGEFSPTQGCRKVLYRTAVEEVPEEDYEIPLGKADIMREGTDVTVVGWGGQLRVLEKACDLAAKEGISVELIDLQTILPWDAATIEASVLKTGKLVVSHEAPITCGFGAEIVATLQERCFLSLEAPIQRVCGYDTPFPFVFEKQYIPDEFKNLEAIRFVTQYGV